MCIPRNYAEAKRFFEDRRFKYRNFRTVANNTDVVELYGEGPNAYGIKLHNTIIITYYHGGEVAMDNYDSYTTNSRRTDAGKPVIRSASSMGVPKDKRLLMNRRWDVGHRADGVDLPYGLPADRPLLFDSTGSIVGAAELTEEIWVPRVEDQRERKALLRWTRKHLLSVVHSMEQLDAFPPGLAEWGCNASDLAGLKAKWEEAKCVGQRSVVLANFIDRELEITPMAHGIPFHVAYSLGQRLKALTPSAALSSRTPFSNPPAELWDQKTVRCADLPLYLD